MIAWLPTTKFLNQIPSFSKQVIPISCVNAWHDLPPEKQHATFQKCIGQYLACLSKFKPWRFPILRWVTHAGANGAKWASISFGWIMGHLCGRMSEAPNKSESMGSNLVILLGANSGHKFQGISINYCLVVGSPILSRFLFMAIYFSGIS